jgi:hypothetical protein
MIIHGSDINLAAKELAEVKSLADLKKLEIFSHLATDQADLANAELFAILKPVKVKAATAGEVAEA